MRCYTEICRVFLGGWLLCAGVYAWAGHQPGHEGERLTPEQVGGEKRMGALLHEARVLAQRGGMEAAVRNYLHVFNYGRGIARLEIVRLALIPAELAALGESFPPALQALREEARVRAGLVLTGVAGTDEVLELLSLNRALNQPRRSLELYDQLKNMGESARAARLLMRSVLGQELLEARRFDELGEEIVALAQRQVERLTLLDVESEFGAVRNAYSDERRAAALSNAPLLYEALLSTKHDGIAKIFADRTLRVDASISGYTALVSAARQAQRPDAAQQLVQGATKVLKADEISSLKKLLAD